MGHINYNIHMHKLKMNFAMTVFDMSNIHSPCCQNKHHNMHNTEINKNENDRC